MIEARNSQWSREFALAVECCRQSFRDPADQSARLSETVDWQHFLKIVRFHRIEGVAWNCLSLNRAGLPEPVAIQLKSAASRIAANNLRAAHDCSALQDAFAAVEIPVLFLKGLPLGALAYGNAAIKSSIDIDLLIDPEHLLPSANILRRYGYRLVAPAEFHGDQILPRWHRGWKESVWRRDQTQIDLHTRTADNRLLIPDITVRSPHQDVQVGDGIALSTLADDEMFAYLAVHGASSVWFRLKWMADFGGFLSSKSATNIEHLYRHSQRLGAGRAAGMALLLADELFGTLNMLPDLRSELRRNPSTARLFRTALRLLLREPIEPTGTRLGTLPIHAAQLLLLPGLDYKFSEMRRQFRRLFDRPPA